MERCCFADGSSPSYRVRIFDDGLVSFVRYWNDGKGETLTHFRIDPLAVEALTAKFDSVHFLDRKFEGRCQGNFTPRGSVILRYTKGDRDLDLYVYLECSDRQFQDLSMLANQIDRTIHTNERLEARPMSAPPANSPLHPTRRRTLARH